MLRYKADYKTLFTVLLYFSLIVFSWINFSFKWYIFIPLLIANCCMAFIITVIVHNTIHSPIFKNRWANKIFQVVLTIANGHPVSGFVAGHNLSHHKHLLTKKDFARPTKLRYGYNLFNQLLFSFNVLKPIAASERRYVVKMAKERPEWFWQYIAEFTVVTGLKIILLAIDWQRTLFMIIIPFIYSNWGILGTNFWQHDGCDGNHAYNHSRSFTSKWMNFFLFNNGYHGAHHNKANLHWSLYPAYHKEHIAPFTHPNLLRNSLIAYLFETCIYPAKRLDYLGNPIIIMDEMEDEDWVAVTNINDANLVDDIGIA